MPGSEAEFESEPPTPEGRPVIRQFRRNLPKLWEITNFRVALRITPDVVRFGGVRELLECLGHGINADHKTSEGEGLLHLAAVANETNPSMVDVQIMVQLLISSGAFVDLRATDDATPLLRALSRNNGEVAHILLEHKADPFCTTTTGKNSLMVAAEVADLDLLNLLQAVGCGSLVNETDTVGMTPLLYSAQACNLVALRWFLELDADPHVTDKVRRVTCNFDQSQRGQNALNFAVANPKCSPDVVELLLDSEIDVHNHGCQDGYSVVLRTALCQSDVNAARILRLLLPAKANVDDKSKQSDSVLSVAASMGKLQTVKTLVRAKASPSALNLNGESALWLAAANGHDNIVKILIAEDGDVDTCSKSIVSPLIVSVRNGHLDCARALLAVGADYSVVGPQGTALQEALSREDRNSEIVQILLSAAAGRSVQAKRVSFPSSTSFTPSLSVASTFNRQKSRSMRRVNSKVIKESHWPEPDAGAWLPVDVHKPSTSRVNTRESFANAFGPRSTVTLNRTRLKLPTCSPSTSPYSRGKFDRPDMTREHFKYELERRNLPPRLTRLHLERLDSTVSLVMPAEQGSSDQDLPSDSINLLDPVTAFDRVSERLGTPGLIHLRSPGHDVLNLEESKHLAFGIESRSSGFLC